MSNQKLFNYMAQEHGVSLLESQEHDIISIVNAELERENARLKEKVERLKTEKQDSKKQVVKELRSILYICGRLEPEGLNADLLVSALYEKTALQAQLDIANKRFEERETIDLLMLEADGWLSPNLSKQMKAKLDIANKKLREYRSKKHNERT